MSEKKQIKVSEVIALIENGKTRSQIREELGLSLQELAVLFKHPKLKNRRAKSVPTIEIIDDLEETLEVVEDEDTPLEEESSPEYLGDVEPANEETDL